MAKLGPDRHQTLIIAEAGVNHNGDLDLAMQLVRAAADSGADVVKFQTFRTERIVTRAAPKAEYQKLLTGDDTQFEMLRKLELTDEMHVALIGECHNRGIEFMSTGFDEESVDFLVALGQRRIKIPSGEITNRPYLTHIGRLGFKVILSTGMASLGEVEAAIGVLQEAGTKRGDITVLHCTTEYPAPFAEVNLRAMGALQAAFGTAVGYSDHTVGPEISIAAVALGASVIEKHFTVSRDLVGPDHQASLEVDEFAAMVSAIRNVEISLGDGVKRPMPSEQANKLIARKSIVARHRIAVGDVFSDANLVAKRPGGGISPMLWDDVVGRTAKRSFDPDEQIEI